MTHALKIDSLPARSLTLTLPDGDEGTEATVALMAAAAMHAAKHDPRIQRAGQTLRRNNPGPIGEALYCYLRTVFRFKADPRGLEHVRHPSVCASIIAKTRQPMHADCDDLAAFAAAVIYAAGLQPLIFTVARGPGQFEHVYAGVRINGTDFPIDCQEGTPPGKHPAGVVRSRRYVLPPLA